MFDPKGPSVLELARQALSGTTEGYDLLAPKFEYTPFRTPDELLAAMVDAIAERPVERALDLCCGNGAIARAIHGVVEEEIVGIDLSEGMIREASSLAEELEPGPNMRFVVGDALQLDAVEEFDVVATSGAFGHLLEPVQPQFVDRIWRSLVDGGRFVFITAEKPTPREPAWWAARGFNAAMHIRNLLIDPPFIMFYLTFPVGRATEVLWKRGFSVEVRAPFEDSPLRRARLVIATKPTGSVEDA